MEDAEPPETCILLRPLLGRALLSHNSVLQIRQSHKEQLRFVPSPVRNDKQSFQAPRSTQDTSVIQHQIHSLPDTAWAGGGHMQIKEQELPLTLPADN